MEFSQFLFEAEEEEKNIQAMLQKLPKKHADLVRGFKFRYVPGNTLKGDDEHIGLIKGKTITVAGPWNYGREFTTLHEIAHLVFERLVNSKLRKEWSKLVRATVNDQKKKISTAKSALEQNDEEIFCMAYATTYAKHPPTTYSNKEWQKFIRNKVPK